MSIAEYFEQTEGFGVLCTADDLGRVNAAVFESPHFFDDDTVGFIMDDRLTRHNLKRNVQAVYLFREDPPNGKQTYKGRRVYLRLLKEDRDAERIERLRRTAKMGEWRGKFLGIFEIEETLPLIGPGEDPPPLKR